MGGDWLTLLSVHEGRHMFQFDATNRNVVHGFFCLFGDNAFVPLMPMWWFEGDAVMAETALTESGRGRNPAFSAQFKAMMLDDQVYGYNKLLLGSHNDYIPDQYTFGYLMYAYIRSHYDPAAPETLFSAYSKCPLPVVGASVAMKKATGKGVSRIYREMAAEYGKFWKEQVASLDCTPVSVLDRPTGSSATLYQYLTVCPDGSIAASRLDFDKGLDIIRIKDGKQTVLCKGYPANSFGSGGTSLVWDEIELGQKFDKSSSRIVLYDMAAGKKRTLFSRSRYLSPALSPDGARVAMIETALDTSSSLVIAQAADGKETARFPIPSGETWADLSFAGNGSELVFVSSGTYAPAGDQGKRIERIDLSSGAISVVFDAKFENVQQPYLSGTTVFYTSGYSGIDTVYAIEGDGRRYQVMVRPIGAYWPHPVAGTDRMLFIDYADSRGKRVAEASVPRLSWTPIEKVRLVREDFFTDSAKAEPGRGLLLPSNVPRSEIPAEDYALGKEGNKIDTWGILPAVMGYTGVTAFVHSENIAGIKEQQLSLNYDYTNNSAGAGYLYRYRGFVPDVVVQAGSTLRHLGGDYSNEPWGSLGLELPFGGGTMGSTGWNAVLGASAGGRLDDGDAECPLTAYSNALFVNGRWNLALSASWEYEPMATYFKDHPFGFASITVPGALSRDSLIFTAAYENRATGDDAILVPYARGYYDADGLEPWKVTASYSIPLFYPDTPIGSLMYFNMVKLNVFYDYRREQDTQLTQNSAGAEILFHFLPLQLPFELNAGVRYSRLIEEQKDKIDIVFMGIPIVNF